MNLELLQSRKGIKRMETNLERAKAYGSGHPWYYVLGGSTLKPKEILQAVKAKGYKGYMAETMRKADNQIEPQRSEALRKIKEKVLNDFWNDLSCYRALAYELHCDRKKHGVISDAHADIHTSMSLKHNHLYNDFANLITLDELLSRQPDLFGY